MLTGSRPDSLEERVLRRLGSRWKYVCKICQLKGGLGYQEVEQIMRTSLNLGRYLVPIIHDGFGGDFCIKL